MSDQKTEKKDQLKKVKEAAEKAASSVRAELGEHITTENLKNAAPVGRDQIFSPLGLTVMVCTGAAILVYPAIAILAGVVFLGSVYLKSKMGKK